jgi:predicted transposase YbfD/YdcC
VVCGADTWVDVELFGKSKKGWLDKFLELPNGIPSHDTFGRVFAMLDAQRFQSRFIDWVRAVSELTAGQVVAIDGKTLRRSHDRTAGKAAIHMVSAWASANELVLGQTKVDDKSNEITAIPELLRVLEISGCIVTIDAMGCHKEIAKTIVRGPITFLPSKRTRASSMKMSRTSSSVLTGRALRMWSTISTRQSTRVMVGLKLDGAGAYQTHVSWSISKTSRHGKSSRPLQW